MRVLAVFTVCFVAANAGRCPTATPTRRSEENITPSGKTAYKMIAHDENVVDLGYEPGKKYSFAVVGHHMGFKRVNISATNDEACGTGEIIANYQVKPHNQCPNVLHEKTSRTKEIVKFFWIAPECGCVTIWSSVKCERGMLYFDNNGEEQLSKTICMKHADLIDGNYEDDEDIEEETDYDFIDDSDVFEQPEDVEGEFYPEEVFQDGVNPDEMIPDEIDETSEETENVGRRHRPWRPHHGRRRYGRRHQGSRHRGRFNNEKELSQVTDEEYGVGETEYDRDFIDDSDLDAYPLDVEGEYYPDEVVPDEMEAISEDVETVGRRHRPWSRPNGRRHRGRQNGRRHYGRFNNEKELPLPGRTGWRRGMHRGRMQRLDGSQDNEGQARMSPRMRPGMKWRKHGQRGMQRKPWKQHKMPWNTLEEKVEFLCKKINFKETRKEMKDTYRQSWFSRVKGWWEDKMASLEDRHWKPDNWTAERREQIKSCCEKEGEEATACFLDVKKGHLDQYCDEGRPMGLWRRAIRKQAKKPHWLAPCCDVTGEDRYECISDTWQQAINKRTNCTFGEEQANSSESDEENVETEYPDVEDELEMAYEFEEEPIYETIDEVVEDFTEEQASYDVDDFIDDITDGIHEVVQAFGDVSDDVNDNLMDEYDGVDDDEEEDVQRRRPDRRHRVKMLKKRCCSYGKSVGKKTRRQRWAKCTRLTGVYALKLRFGPRMKIMCKKVAKACCLKTPFDGEEVTTTLPPTEEPTTMPTTTTAESFEMNNHIPEVPAARVVAIKLDYDPATRADPAQRQGRRWMRHRSLNARGRDRRN